MDRPVDAIADGGQTFLEVIGKMHAARAAIEALNEALAAMEGAQVSALRPKIAAGYGNA